MDTSVLYAALRSSSGASFFILDLIRSGKLELAISIPVFTEYQAVLSRGENLEAFKLKQADIEAVLRFIAFAGRPFLIHFLLRPNLIDETDNMFVELAFASKSKFLITANTKDFIRKSELKLDCEIITPADFVRLWREHHAKKE